MRKGICRATLVSICLTLAALNGFALDATPTPRTDLGLFARTNLVAWCIVPFDAKKRGPEERAAMLEKLGFKLFAYDYRAEHVSTFDAEMEALKRHHVRLLAWWFPSTLNEEAKLILDVIKRHGLRDVQLWLTGGGEQTKSAEEQRARVEAEAQRLRPIAEAAARIGCTVALYNHGAWFGEPENQIEIIAKLRAQGVTNVGIVYNLHHGHGHLDRFAELLAKMKPHLLALNLNGMVHDGDKLGKKILPLGQGDLDLKILRIICASGWRGPIGILNHTDEDAEVRLQENLRGLERLVGQGGLAK
jgi:sugar phosphate isomerase/epimerase